MLSRSLSLLKPMKSHKGNLWAVREANPSDLFTKQSQDAGHTLEWKEFNSVHVFLSIPRCPPHRTCPSRRAYSPGNYSHPKAKNGYSPGGSKSIRFAIIPGFSLCLELQYRPGKCLLYGNPNSSGNCPKNFESYREEQVMTAVLKSYWKDNTKQYIKPSKKQRFLCATGF